MLKPCHTIIFDDDTNHLFSKLLDIFHEVCVDDLLCFGKVVENTSISNTQMSYVNDDKPGLEQIFQTITKTPADLLIVAPTAELALVYMSPENTRKRYYCLQVVKDFFPTGEDCCQVWEVNKHVTNGHLTKLWNDVTDVV